MWLLVDDRYGTTRDQGDDDGGDDEESDDVEGNGRDEAQRSPTDGSS